MPKKEMFTSRFEETRGGRVPKKSIIWGDVVYGWSLTWFFPSPIMRLRRGPSAELCTYIKWRLSFLVLREAISSRFLQEEYITEKFEKCTGTGNG